MRHSYSVTKEKLPFLLSFGVGRGDPISVHSSGLLFLIFLNFVIPLLFHFCYGRKELNLLSIA